MRQGRWSEFRDGTTSGEGSLSVPPTCCPDLDHRRVCDEGVRLFESQSYPSPRPNPTSALGPLVYLVKRDRPVLVPVGIPPLTGTSVTPFLFSFRRP